MCALPVAVRVPGKLMVAGEYAILSPDHKAVVMAVNRFVTVTRRKATGKACTLSAPNVGIQRVDWHFDGQRVVLGSHQPQLNFIAEAISTALQYLAAAHPIQFQPIHLDIASDLDHVSGRKLGLGSSAAVVVGVIAALQGDSIIPHDVLFKLAALAHYRAQGSGSGADIAAAVYGGALCYTAFYAAWLGQQIADGQRVDSIVHSSWPGLSVAQLTWPASLEWSVGWTGQAASTAQFLEQIRIYRVHSEAAYATFLQESSKAVQTLLEGLETERPDTVLAGLKQNREALAHLGLTAGVPIETEALKLLADLAERLGGAGKLSGAGGGDCGIAAMRNAQAAEALQAEWTAHGIEPLGLEMTQHGVTRLPR